MLWFPTLLPPSLPPVPFTPPSAASFPLPASLHPMVTVSEHPCPAQNHCSTRASPFPALDFSFPICTMRRGGTLGSPVIHHCHHYPSMEQVLIEKCGGAAKSSHLWSTNCAPGPAPSETKSSPLHARKLRLRGTGTHLRIHNQRVTLELSTTCPPLAGTYLSTIHGVCGSVLWAEGDP